MIFSASLRSMCCQTSAYVTPSHSKIDNVPCGEKFPCLFPCLRWGSGGSWRQQLLLGGGRHPIGSYPMGSIWDHTSAPGSQHEGCPKGGCIMHHQPSWPCSPSLCLHPPMDLCQERKGNLGKGQKPLRACSVSRSVSCIPATCSGWVRQACTPCCHGARVFWLCKVYL